jgi:hypothetical protein
MADKIGGFTVTTPDTLRGSLAQRLVPVVDRVRDLNTSLGMRPYRVRIVRTRWAGGRRGVGVESVVFEIDILPTPKVVDLNTLQEMVTPVGVTEIGLVQLQEVSGRYSEDFLVGVDASGSPVPDSDDVYYEIEWIRADGKQTDRHRFTLAVVPYYAATKVQWTLTLDAQLEKRRRDGRPRP